MLDQCENKFTKVNGINICYKEFGIISNYPVIFIHGFGSKKETYIGQVDDLSKDFRAIIFDNRGAGKSDRPEGPYTMDIYIDDTIGLMDYLNIEQAHIVGFSMGGMIAQNLALKFPERVNKMVLINTYGQISNKIAVDKFKEAQYAKIELIKNNPEKAFWDSTTMGFHVKFRKRMKLNPSSKFYGLWSANDLIDYIKSDPPSSKDIDNMVHAVKGHDFLDKLSSIKIRTLVLAASHDKLTPPEALKEIHNKLPNSEYMVIEKAGHESPKEKAPQVNRAILDFLRS